jgi:hypothetical protein
MDRECKVTKVTLYFLSVKTRVPLKFGAETLESAEVARVAIEVEGASGKKAVGWGETPLSAPWAWPSSLEVGVRTEVMKETCRQIGGAIESAAFVGHPMDIGSVILETILPQVIGQINKDRGEHEKMPHLAGLICSSPFDIAIHDAYGTLNSRDIYSCYDRNFMTGDLSTFIEGTPADGIDFQGKYPADFLEDPQSPALRAWHLVGGKDPVTAEELTGDEPTDEYPVLLEEWIKRDGLGCLKIKLRGNDEVWDYERIVSVGSIAGFTGVDWLSADFNCTVTEPAYVNEILDRLRDRVPAIYGSILYVEQPFPYDLERHQIDVHSVSARKPLFMDESAHDWKLVRLGRSLGWTGVALKTCKTQSGALLSMCWAKAHGMTLMVQDLTNPMLAQIPHLRLAHHAGTIMGVETNSMQFYPEASTIEEKIHPGMYRRRGGCVDLASLGTTGFGYRNDEIARSLPAAENLTRTS